MFLGVLFAGSAAIVDRQHRANETMRDDRAEFPSRPDNLADSDESEHGQKYEQDYF
jgi:hypothetical protein